jgi:serine/threonine protein kinase
MELCHTNLRKWLDKRYQKDHNNQKKNLALIHDILMGLIELHDRHLVHGDFKPSNILIKKKPLRAVLGDCGFVSVAKYVRVENTSPLYMDPILAKEATHDIFSFGVCFLELAAGILINKPHSYKELRSIVKLEISERKYRRIAYSIFDAEKEKRPTAREIIHSLFSVTPDQWISSDILDPHFRSSLPEEATTKIRHLMKDNAQQHQMDRCYKGYGALLIHLEQKKVDLSQYRIYVGVTLMIASALFGTTGFRMPQVIQVCEGNCDDEIILKILAKLLSDFVFIHCLLAPPKEGRY